MKLSLLLPTRHRPALLDRCIRSALDTAADPDRLEVVVRYDHDDQSTAAAAILEDPHVVSLRGERTLMSNNWNEAWRAATGDVGMHAGDDLVFRSKAWDVAIRTAFTTVADRILFVHGNDGKWDGALGTHGFLHRRWVETVGYFVPPYFSSAYNDTWLTNVADQLGRHLYLPDVYIEHMHWSFGKMAKDQTAEDVEARVPGNEQRFGELAPQREADVAKLRALLGTAA